MAVVSITIPDALIPRLVAAARSRYPEHAALSDVATFKAITAAHWKTILVGYESEKSYEAAITQATLDANGIS